VFLLYLDFNLAPLLKIGDASVKRYMLGGDSG